MAKNVVEVDGEYWYVDDKTYKVQQLVLKDVPSMSTEKFAKIMQAVEAQKKRNNAKQ